MSAVPVRWLLAALILTTVAAADDVKYTKCKLIADSGDSTARRNSGAVIRIHLTCKNEENDDITVIDEHTSVSEIDTTKFVATGTPLTFFDIVDDESMIVRIADYMEEEPFELYDSEFLALPKLMGGPASAAPLTIQSSRVKLTNCTFSGNSQRTAGAIHLRPETEAATTDLKTVPSLIVEDSMFETGKGGVAGAIVSDGYPEIVLKKSTFRANTRTSIDHRNGGMLSIVDCLFDGEEGPSVSRKHAVSMMQGSGQATIHISRSTFKGHYAKMGSVVSWEAPSGSIGPKIDLEGSVFRGNSAVFGGVLRAQGPITLGIHGCNFTENLSDHQGGVLSFALKDSDDFVFSASDSVFERNMAPSAGAIDIVVEKAFSSSGETASNGSVQFTNVDFLSNTASNEDGGAVRVEGSDSLTMSIRGGLYKNNVAETIGGALKLLRLTHLTIQGARFEDNTLTEPGPVGGAVFAGNIDTVTVSGSVFERNMAGAVDCRAAATGDKGGGALAVISSSIYDFENSATTKTVTIIDCEFKENSAEVTGGAVFVSKYDRLEMAEVTMSNSKAHSAGALKVDSVGDVSIERSFITKNEACGWDGGAMFLHKTAAVSVTNSRFHANKASSRGSDAGGIKIQDVSKAILTHVEFVNNTAAGKAGAVYVKGDDTIQLTQCRFSGNKGSYGGALRIVGTGGGDKEKVEIAASVFDNNEATTTMGGAVDATSFTSMNLKDCEFISNEAVTNGGSIYVSEGGDITMSSCTVGNNSAGESGAGIYVSGGRNMTLVSTILRANTAGGSGGGMFLGAIDALDISGSIVEDNVAGSAGAGICLENGGSVKVARTPLTSNRATQGGGLNLDRVKDVHFNNLALQNNNATGEGAAVRISEADSIEVTGATATGSTSVKGGAFYLYGIMGSVTFARSSFDGNSASEDGGAIFIKKTGAVTLHDIPKMDSCTAEGNGGGMFLDQAKSLTVVRTKVNGGSAKEGAAFFVSGVETVSFEDAAFHGNTATTHGGAISADPSASFNCTICDFESNKAGGDGGSITLARTRAVSLSDASFKGTTAGGNGGALALVESTSLDMKSVKLSGCKANNGGCFFMEGVKELSGHSVDFTDVEAVASGGLLDLQKTDKVSLKGWQGGHASAGANGGALSLVDVGTVALEHCQLDDAKAGASGGAIFASGVGKFTVASLHTNNTEASTGTGGSLALARLTVSITGSTISSSSAGSHGGCIAVESSPSFTMTTSGLVSCVSDGGDGGAIHLPDISEVHLVSTKLTGSSAPGGNGGGLFVAEAESIQMEGVIVENCAAQTGGGAHIRDVPMLPLDGIVLKGCSAKQGGGLLAEGVADGGVRLSKAVVEGNHATDVQGGGVSIETSGPVMFDESTFSSNSAGGSGGAALVKTKATFVVSGGAFTSNSAKQGDGGALMVKTTEPVTISNVAFDKCTAVQGAGGAVRLTSSKSVGIRGVAITGASGVSAKSGGGVSLLDVGDVTVDDLRLTSLKSTGDGGGLFVSDATTTKLYNLVVKDGVGGNGAGVFLQRAGDVSVTTYTADGVVSTRDGGAIFLEKSGNAALKAVTVSGAKADNGGAIFVSDVGQFTGQDVKLDGVQATTDGGGVFVFLAPSVDVSNVVVKNSKALNGAGMYVQDVGALSGKVLSFEHDTSVERGGGLFAKTIGSVHLSDITCVGGRATTGAALWLEKVDADKFGRHMLAENSAASVVIDGATFTDNVASEQGGAVFASKLAGAKFTDIKAESNSAGGAGGAIYASDSTSLDVANSNFDENKASGGGGTLAVNGIEDLEVESSTISHSTGKMGGAIFVANAEYVVLKDGVVSESQADENGGGVLLDNVGSLNAMNMAFKENSASAGGALDIAGGGDVIMTKVKFEDNRAETWEGSNIQVSSCDSSVQVANSQIGVPAKKAISMITSEHSLNEAMHQNPACPGELIQMDGCEVTYKTVGMDSRAIIIIAVLSCLGLVMLGMVVAVMKAHNPLNAEDQEREQEEDSGRGARLDEDAPIIPLLAARKSLDMLEHGIGWVSNPRA